MATIMLALLTLLLIPKYANTLKFNIPRFDPKETNIIYTGDAIASVGAIELINHPNYLCQVGWATYYQHLPLYDSNKARLADFATHFSYSIIPQTTPYGNGMAFFLIPVGFQIPPNSIGGFLGLFNTTTSDSSHNRIVMVEFDTVQNDWDPDYHHIGINNNSISSAVLTPWNSSIAIGDNMDVWISYNASAKNLSVQWSYQNSEPENVTSLSYAIDLKEVLPQWVSIGFSAGTGKYSQRNTIHSWEFSSNLEINEPVGKSDNSNTKNKRELVKITIGLTVSVVVLIVVLVIIATQLWFNKCRQRDKEGVLGNTNLMSISNKDIERRAGPRRYSYADLSSATNNFSIERKLGQGGFGAVYRGYLPDLDALVAVKKISNSSLQGRREYLAEVMIISQLRQRNLVKLLGWCHEDDTFLLVYEFMPKGSLDKHLFDNTTRALIWSVRYKILLGLASALVYLHEECEDLVIHRDIKASNVMLDSSFNAKLGDFGLARLMDHGVGPQITSRLMGTLGYVDPEYIKTGKACKESDVYSFGVVCLEIATGRKAMDRPMGEDSSMGLVQWVWSLYGNDDVVSSVDESLDMNFDEQQLKCVVAVGLWCAHLDMSQRPSIRQAVQVLNFEAELPRLTPPSMSPVPPVPPQLMSSGSNPGISSSIELGR